MTFDALRRRWGSFARSPLLPAAVIAVIAAAAAALFAGSYSYAMANPAPRDIPVAVTGTPTSYAAQQAFLNDLQHATGTSLHLHQYDTYAQAREAVDQQREFAILQLHSGAAEFDVSSASGATVAEVLARVSPQVGQSIGHTVTVRDINPLQPGDPRGLAIFYITLATVIVGFVSAIQLSVHAGALRLGQLMAVTAAYAALGGLAIIAVIDWGLGTLQLPVAESWLILSLTLFTSGAIFQMFNSLVGRWALAPTWILLVILGSPTSGGAVAWPLLPTPFRVIGQWLPTGAAVNAQHTAIYFSQNQYVFPFLVLLAWAVVSWTVVALRRRAAPASAPASARASA